MVLMMRAVKYIRTVIGNIPKHDYRFEDFPIQLTHDHSVKAKIYSGVNRVHSKRCKFEVGKELTLRF